MTKRTQAELLAIEALEQFAAGPPVIKPVQKKPEPQAVQEEAPAPKKASKAKAKKQAVADEPKQPKRPPNIIVQKFQSLGWMAKGMVILLILGLIGEIIKRL